MSLGIRPLVRKGGIRDDIHAIGTIGFGPDDEDDDNYHYGVSGIAFEVSTLDHANRWIRLRCTFTIRGSTPRFPAHAGQDRAKPEETHADHQT